jgi:hypothetical protein
MGQWETCSPPHGRNLVSRTLQESLVADKEISMKRFLITLLVLVACSGPMCATTALPPETGICDVISGCWEPPLDGGFTPIPFCDLIGGPLNAVIRQICQGP